MSRRFAKSCALFAFSLVAAGSNTVAQSPFSFIKWRSIGPVNTGGRIDDIAVARVRGEPDAIYVATASGGLFKSANNGVSWSPVFDSVDAMMSIGAVAVAPSAPSTVWVGTGEANTRQSSSWGDGVYRSTDGGKTWSNMGLRDTRAIARIVIDPGNANNVYVAAQGHLWGPNADRGVFKTTDGGLTWKKTLFVDENTGATDLVIDPTNSQTLYAATYQHMRRTWGYNGGGVGSGIYKSTDGGNTWTKLGGGLPTGELGRIGISLLPTDSRIVYATIEAHAPNSGIYRTLDGGVTWQKTSSLNSRPNYYSQIRIDPRSADRIYTLGSNRGFYFSNDSGKTFTERFSDVHGEDHALWVDPDNTNHLIIGGDGGVSISWDRGRTWDFRHNMPIGQFYEIDADNSVPFRVCGGLQDNGVWCVPSAVRNRNGIADRDAWNIGGGDGFHAHFDPTNNSMVLQSSQNGNAAWVNIETLERQGARPGTGDRPAAAGAGGVRGGRGGAAAAAPVGEGAAGGAVDGRGAGNRWNWDTPIVVSHHDPKTWFMGSQFLYKSTDRGSSWKKISGDLTLNADRDMLKMMGSVVPSDALSRHDGQTSYGS
ncbi:MAG: sialidase family protein, partial [Gemmatimonadaceae bacterium]